MDPPVATAAGKNGDRFRHAATAPGGREKKQALDLKVVNKIAKKNEINIEVVRETKTNQ